MKQTVKVAFASGPDDLNAQLIERMRRLYPELPLYVVSEFAPADGTCDRWIPYHVAKSFVENLARCRAALRGARIRLAGVLLVPQMPYRRMRLIALVISPRAFLAFNEHFDSFMLRPRSAFNIARYVAWRGANLLRSLRHARTVDWIGLVHYWWELALGLGVAAAKLGAPAGPMPRPVAAALPEGISVVIPTRDGRELLAAMLPRVERDLEGVTSEIIVVDNGSSDGSAGFLAAEHPGVSVEISAEPLSFACAVNRGIARARYSHVCLLNNDMLIEPDFFRALRTAFDGSRDLFCAGAQILFPPGARREETGKQVFASDAATDFPVRCDVPIPGEDQSYVLYGSGGASLYDTRKLRALGGMDEAYQPAYVEDLDAGYRAWLCGWPSVFVAGARVEHRHRATTSRFYSPQQLDAILEANYLRFLCRAIGSPRVAWRLWRQAALRRKLLRVRGDVPFEPLCPPAPAFLSEPEVLALTSDDVAVFPGRARGGESIVAIVSPYVPFPLSHGGAVRMYNLMRRAADRCRQVLIAFSTSMDPPAPELLDICAEIVLVRLRGSHSRPTTERPEVVEEFASTAFAAALRETLRKWNPAVVQMEFTQMAQYAPLCRPARTILVEHDVTFDLYEQLLRINDDWDLRRQLSRWRRFETEAWRRVDRVVVMSERDRAIAAKHRVSAVVIPNGVDLDRFRPSAQEPAARRLLFIGSFAHLPNLLALDFFLREVWPLLDSLTPRLHVIAGSRHEYFLRHYRDRVEISLDRDRVEVEGFVADVRPAYERAAVVIAPLVASAGTNIKILEAMAMGKAIVSTPAGVNGLDVRAQDEAIIASTPAQFADAVRLLLASPDRRRELGARARAAAEQRFDWNRIAENAHRYFM